MPGQYNKSRELVAVAASRGFAYSGVSIDTTGKTESEMRDIKREAERIADGNGHEVLWLQENFRLEAFSRGHNAKGAQLTG